MLTTPRELSPRRTAGERNLEAGKRRDERDESDCGDHAGEPTEGVPRSAPESRKVQHVGEAWWLTPRPQVISIRYGTDIEIFSDSPIPLIPEPALQDDHVGS